MKPSRFETDLKNLAQDLATVVQMKKQPEPFHEALLECLTGLKTFNKKIENLVSTGDLLKELFLDINELLPLVFQKNNKDIHKQIMDSIIKVFTKYGTATYKEKLIKECQSVPATAWDNTNISIPSEKLVALLLNSYSQYVKTKKITGKKALIAELDKLMASAQLLLDTESSLEYA